MDGRRFDRITSAYRRLKVVVAGDFCLDRYLHIDPALEEVSLETHLPAHQVARVRPQPGGAGNVLANVAALAPAAVRAVGVCGCDGEGYELTRALHDLGADLKGFLRTKLRRTFTYTKPLIERAGAPPEELPRLDIRDRTSMPEIIVRRLIERLQLAAAGADVVILMEQAPDARQGALSPGVKDFLARLIAGCRGRGPVFLADSRCDVTAFAGVDVKLNRQELRRHAGGASDDQGLARRLSGRLDRRVFVTLGADGILAAQPDGAVHRVPGIPVAGPIDVVGCGDTVLAHLALALGAGATAGEAIELANAAGSVVVRKVGTTGTATIGEVRDVLGI